MNITRDQLFDVFSPLCVALHEKGVIDIAELPHFYEDALARRMPPGGQPLGDPTFLRELIAGLHRLATVVKQQDQTPPT